MKKNQLILVVDDDEEILTMLSRTLELEGYDAITASNGRIALSLMEEHKPDLVILDIMMPELDGIQTLKLIRQRSEVPVIMLTARFDMPTLNGALALGAGYYIKKPFRIQELLARIQAILKHAK